VRTINLLHQVFYWLLLLRIVFSFLRLGRDAHPTLLAARRFVYMMTEPLLAPLRKIIRPVHMGGGAYLDLSPLVALILINMLRGLLVRLVMVL
jgi:YggT family protein